MDCLDEYIMNTHVYNSKSQSCSFLSAKNHYDTSDAIISPNLITHMNQVGLKGMDK